MRADPPSVPPLPDARALLLVVDAVRNAPGSTRDALANAALQHPEAPGFEAAQLRRLAESYGDAQLGFRRPQASAGYVLAALYTMRRRIGLWIGIPFLVLLAIGSAHLGISEWTRRRELALLRRRCTWTIENSQRSARAAGDEVDAVESALRSAQPPLPNEARIRDLIRAFRERQTEASTFFSSYQPVDGLDARRLRALRRDADEIGSLVSGLDNLLQQMNEQLGRSAELRIARNQLDGLFKEARAGNGPSAALARIEGVYASGVWASEQGDATKLAEAGRELRGYVVLAREREELPRTLDALIAQIRSVALDEEDRKRAEDFYRDGRDAPAASRVSALQKSVRELREMAETLEEEYTIVITGGKWRYRNNDPSVKTYYLLVEALDSSGHRLSRMVRNEEDQSVSRVTTWGERVPFEVYERVRRDKADHGVIQQNEFGRKERGRLEERVTLRRDNREPLPRAGKITRW